ncbi:MAG TPA: hypothetical protein VKV26_06700 [Dehalococcoidia bacterium]|nr:hypothetical protein [Dehalococcoidia bacterium]
MPKAGQRAKASKPSEIDPAFAPVIDAFAGDGQVLLGKIFVSTGLQVNGRFFAFVRKGAMVVKLPRERVRALIESGAGEPFDRGKGTPLPEWAVIPPGRADWVAIAREARRFVGGEG